MKILARRVLVFALLVGLTSGLRLMPDSIDWHTAAVAGDAGANEAEAEEADDIAYQLLDWLDQSTPASTCQ